MITPIEISQGRDAARRLIESGKITFSKARNQRRGPDIKIQALRETDPPIGFSFRGATYELPLREAVGALNSLNEALGKCEAMTMSGIVSRVSQCSGVSVSDIMGKRKPLDVAWARNVAMFLMRDAGYTLKEIGAHFNSDHSSPYTAIERIRLMLLENHKATTEIVSMLRLK